jgi:hypothetical protein
MQRMTTMERAFHLARSGRYACLTEMVATLDRDGYSASQIQGSVLKRQLKGLIKAAHAEPPTEISRAASGAMEQLPARKSDYATNARSALAVLPSIRFLNEIANDPAPATSLPSRLPFRSYICANKDSNPSPVAPDPAVSNDGQNLPRVRIENDILGKDEILSHGFCLEDDGLSGKASGFVISHRHA